MIRKRRRKKKLDLQEKQRNQMVLLIIGAAVAAVLAAGLPTSCNSPITPFMDEEEIRERMEDLAKEAESRGR